jgi:hypothetical protein
MPGQFFKNLLSFDSVKSINFVFISNAFMQTKSLDAEIQKYLPLLGSEEKNLCLVSLNHSCISKKKDQPA